MRLYSLQVLFKEEPSGKVNCLSATHDLSTFSFFQRSSVKEFVEFTARIIAERTTSGSRASVKEQEYLCHVHVRPDGLCAVVVADHEYPQRVAHTLITKVLDEFTELHPASTWKSASTGSLGYPNGERLLTKYQDPKEADAMTKIQADVDETKIILHNTIEAVLNRGEKLDDLVYKSEELGAQSKAFYKTAKKTNSCCTIL